MARVLMP